MTEITNILSPCIDVCDVDSTGQYCIGCGRSMDEIARWMSISNEQRQAIIKELHERQRQLKP
jgi:predicted Fe-S protein YdhL (DUF1289 family)